MAGDDPFPTRYVVPQDDGEDRGPLPSPGSLVVNIGESFTTDARGQGRRYEQTVFVHSDGHNRFEAVLPFGDHEYTSVVDVGADPGGYVLVTHRLEPPAESGILSRLRGSADIYSRYDVSPSVAAERRERRSAYLDAHLDTRVVSTRVPEAAGAFDLRFETSETAPALDVEPRTGVGEYLEKSLPKLAVGVAAFEKRNLFE